MVLLGGLGPQGHGFTYSTPKGEVVEICSDIKENEAIIVKYKQFLKEQFLVRLEKELENFEVEKATNQKIKNFLTEIINSRELITYYKKEPIMKKIRGFLGDDQKFRNLIEKISNSITVILRPIDTIDQFKCRMEMVAEEKIQSEEIGSLTSLKDKSHYDVLKERFFYQYIIDWFQKIYNTRKTKIGR